MSSDLRQQLESAAASIDLVKVKHYVMFNKTEAGPVAFLLDRMDPKDGQSSMLMRMEVGPVFDSKVVVSGGRMHTNVKRRRYKFKFREPRKPVKLKVPASGNACCTQWMKVADRLYDRLVSHDSTAWEELLCMVLDVPSGKGS